MQLTAIKNLTSVEALQDFDASKYEKLEFPTKTKYREWCESIDTDHCFYSPVTPVSESLRVSEDNPPKSISGLVLDYDAPFKGDIIEQINAVCPKKHRPLCITKTYSGFTRMLFAFEEPIPFVTDEVMKAFYKKLRSMLKLDSILPGLDDASFKLNSYFEAGYDWEYLDDVTPIATTLLTGILEKACTTTNLGENPSNIPIEDIRERGKELFPEVNWDSINIGDRISAFWNPSYDGNSATPGMVRVDGVTCYSTTASDKGFLSWGELFGNDWVDQFRLQKIARACEGMWYDTKTYWIKIRGKWYDLPQKDFMIIMKVEKGLDPTTPKGTYVSEIDKALYHMITNNIISKAFPFLYEDEEMIVLNGDRYLNISNLELTKPVKKEGVEWGEGFPILAEYYDGIFDAPADIQKDYYMSWLQQFYTGAYNKKLKRGLSVVMSGPVGSGKGFSTGIMKLLFGGASDASSFLVGGDAYNAEFFKSPIWTAHDSDDSSGNRTTFTKILKRVVADDEFNYRKMYKEGFTMPWKGRVVVSMNDDAESLQMLPDMTLNVADKISLFKVKQGMEVFPSDDQIMKELPFFARWLLDWEAPEETRIGANRFGAVPYHHEELLEISGSLSREVVLEELIMKLITDHCEINSKARWEGTSADLNTLALGDDPAFARQWQNEVRSIVSLGRTLSQLSKEESNRVERATFNKGVIRYAITPESNPF